MAPYCDRELENDAITPAGNADSISPGIIHEQSGIPPTQTSQQESYGPYLRAIPFRPLNCRIEPTWLSVRLCKKCRPKNQCCHGQSFLTRNHQNLKPHAVNEEDSRCMTHQSRSAYFVRDDLSGRNRRD